MTEDGEGSEWAKGAAAAGGDAPAEEAKKEEKEEGMHCLCCAFTLSIILTKCPQRRKSQTRIWVSVYSTKRRSLFPSLRTA